MERQVSGQTSSQTGQTSRDQAAKADLMHATADVAIGQPLNLLPGLDEQAAVGDADWHAAAVLQPHCQTGKARLAVDGQKVQVIVVAGIACPRRTKSVNVHACMPIRVWVQASQVMSLTRGYAQQRKRAAGCCLRFSCERRAHQSVPGGGVPCASLRRKRLCPGQGPWPQPLPLC